MPENNFTQSFDEMAVELNDAIYKMEKEGTTFFDYQKAYANKTNRYIYTSDEAHKIALRDYLPELEAAENKALTTAKAQNANIRQILEKTKTESASLTAAEEAIAASKREFIKEDCTDLGYSQLVNRAQQAINQADRPAMYCFHKYGSMRLGLKEDSTDIDQQAKSAFATLVAAMGQKLTTGKAKEVHDLATKALTHAHNLEAAASKRRRAGQVYSFQQHGEVPWPS